MVDWKAKIRQLPLGWWLALGTLALFSIHLLLTAGRWVPVIAPDEIGPIAIARYLAGVAPMMHLQATPHMSFGMSLLLAPGYALLPNPYAAYKFGIVLNCLLASLVLPLAYVFARRFGVRRHALAAAGLTALYPALWVQTQYLWAEVSLMCGFLALCWLAFRVLDEPSWWRLLALAILAAFLYALHERAMVVPVASAAFLLGLAARERVLAGRLVAVAGLILILAWLVHCLDVYFWRLGWGGSEGVTVSSLMARLSDPQAWAALGKAALLQGWYLLVASLGLAALGVLELWRRARQDGSGHMRLLAFLLLPCSLVMAGASCLVMIDPFRADQYLYGRYNEAILLPWICMGAMQVRHLRWRNLVLVLTLLALLTGFALGFADVRNWNFLLPFNVSAVASYFVAIQGSLAFAAGGLLACAALLWMQMTGQRDFWCAVPPGLAYVLLVAFAMPLLRQVNHDVTSKLHTGRDLLAAMPARQLAYDMDQLPAYLYYHFQAALPGKEVVSFAKGAPPQTAGIVISNANWGETQSDTKFCRIGGEPYSQIIYWALRDSPSGAMCE